MYRHMGKFVIKILQGSAVTQTTLGGLTIYILGLQISYSVMCQKLWKLACSRQSYCKNYQAYFFGRTLYVRTGGFTHVRHVRPNKGETKREGAPAGHVG